MYALGRTGTRRAVNIWPGFVDGLASLLLVVMFVLMVFMVAQFFLTTALSGRDEALEQLNREVSELAELLALERAANADLRINVAQLSSELQSSIAERETLGSQLSLLVEERAAIEARLSDSEQQRASLTSQIAALLEEQESLERLLAEAEAVTEQSRAELEAAYSTIEADRETIETQLAELAILKSLNDEMVAELTSMEEALDAQEESAEALRGRIGELEAQLAARLDERDKLAAQLLAEREALAISEEQLTLSREDREALQARTRQAESERERQSQLSREAQAKVALLNRQIAALRQQLSRLAVALEAAEALNAEREVKIADLGRRLNVALATKVQELARYRSEFFGRLREVLGERKDILVVGDRFVFQSELLFGSGSAEIGPEGQIQLARLAQTLREVAARFPQEIDWILRVDGHTDRRPISSSAFRSNWELSTARALSVVRFLITQGIPARRLAATGFGEFQPIDEGESDEALSRNRRIEMRLDQR